MLGIVVQGMLEMIRIAIYRDHSPFLLVKYHLKLNEIKNMFIESYTLYYCIPKNNFSSCPLTRYAYIDVFIYY